MIIISHILQINIFLLSERIVEFAVKKYVI
jgi:hypothetical protein